MGDVALIGEVTGVDQSNRGPEVDDFTVVLGGQRPQHFDWVTQPCRFDEQPVWFRASQELRQRNLHGKP